VYPNPTHSCINVLLREFRGGYANLILRSTTGQVVYSKRVAVNSPVASLNINVPKGLSAGTYLLQVQNSVYNQVTKVLIK